MARYQIQGPDGKNYEIDGPEGATDEQVRAEVIKQNPQLGADPGYDESNRNLDRAKSAAQGVTLGWGDELYAGAGAVGSEIASMFNDDERTIAERYGETHNRLNDELDAYREAHPIESMGFEVGGGLLTGGAGLTRAAGSVAARTGGRLLGKRALAAAGEGAIAGAGSAREDRLAGAGMGAGLGLGMTGAMRAAGALPKALGKRRVRAKLERDGDFLPIPLAQERGVVPRIYRGLVNKAYGGGDVLQDQAEPHFRRAAARTADAQGAAKALPAKLEAEEIAATGRINQDVASYENAGLKALDEQAAGVKATVRGARDELDRVKMEGQAAVDASPQLLDDVGRQVDAETSALRQTAARASLPKVAGKARPKTQGSLHDEVAGMPAAQAREKIADWWGRHGFADVKRQTYAWSEPFKARLRSVTGENPRMAMELLDDLDTVAPSLVAKVRKSALRNEGNTDPEALAKALKSEMDNLTEIDGDTLMAIRNKFARAGGGQTWKAGVNRRVKRSFDDEIRDQLKAKGVNVNEAFDDQIKAYSVWRPFDGAVDAAWNKRGGDFTADDWLTASRKRLDAPMVGEARGLQKSAAAATEAAKKRQKQVARQARDNSGRFTKALNKTKDQADEALERIKGQKSGVKTAAKDRRKWAERMAKQDIDRKGRTEASANTLSKAKAAEKALSKGLPRDNPSGLSAMLTTGLLGGAVAAPFGAALAGPAGGLAGVALGSQVAKGLASPRVQKAAAGQLKGQRRMAAHLRKNRGKYERIRRAAARTAAMQGDN